MANINVRAKVKVAKTVCKMCYAGCGLDVHVEQGKIVKVEGMKEHPMNKGALCVKAENIVDYVYAEDRIKFPIRKQNGVWKRISWDQALDEISARLANNKEKYGPESLMTFAGDAITITGASMVGERFCDVYGTPNRSSVNAICYVIRTKAGFCTLGVSRSPDTANAKCVVLWGHNPQESIPAYGDLIDRALAGGAKLIVIDPRKIAFAKKADIHAQIRPGTDAALALGLINVIISENLYDGDFVSNWTHGFSELAERASQYPPETVERITWVPAHIIRDIARAYAAAESASIVQGTNTLDQQASGFQTSRCIAILQALTGNVDVPGGYVRMSGVVKMNPLRIPEKVESIRLMGTKEYPISHGIGGKVYGNQQSMEWPDMVLADDTVIRAGIVQGSNPAVIWPNTAKVKKALEKLDFLVVMDLFMTATAEMADIVLPAASFLETDEVCFQTGRLANAPWVMLRKEVIEPVGESWPDWKFWFELGKRMGYNNYFPWKDHDEFLNYMMEPMAATGITLQSLREDHPEGVPFGKMEYGEYKRRGFATPSGKVELYSKMLEELGYDPLPYYTENPETPLSAPEIAKDYPLILTTGARKKEFWHSQFRNLSGLRQRVPESYAEIHADTAAKYGIADGRMMTVESPRGSIQVRARVTVDILPRIVLIPHGWTEGNANYLTDNKPADPISGYPALKGGLCKITPSTQEQG